MSYEHFAYLYDELMSNAPYDDWVKFVIKRCQTYQVSGVELLDLACGTGELSVRFAKEGFQVTGIDLSSDMLSVAQAKAENQGLKIPFFEQNMADLQGHGKFDLIGIFCDSLNYLQTEQEVIQTFANAYEHLHQDGLFMFDVHSLFKISEIFLNQTFTFNEENLAYIWNSFPGVTPNSVEHELSFFVLDDKTGKYDRFDELHMQRTYSVHQYSNWLKAAGFELLEITADFSDREPEAESERIFFVARK